MIPEYNCPKPCPECHRCHRGSCQSPTKPSLSTICGLIRAATNVEEEVRAIAAAHRHYSLTEIREALADYDAVEKVSENRA